MLKEKLGLEKYEEIKAIENNIYKALELVINLFENEKDKGGHPYIVHLMSVYKNVYNEDEKVIALLHDTIEDKKCTKEDLLDLGFSPKIVEDVLILTRVKPMDYNKYIEKIIKFGSMEALSVKLADLKNNMDMSRIKNPTVKDYERIEKRYAPNYEKILNRLEEIEK